MLRKFSLGTGDRFGQEGTAQLSAILRAKKEDDITISPVWNKSHREHEIIGTEPTDVREEAAQAIKKLGWEKDYFVDADHITKEIVDPYINCSDFFTIDVADFIGEKAEEEAREKFVQENRDYIGDFSISGIEEKFTITETFLKNWADEYLLAIQRASEIYEYIRERKSEEAVFEISMDEVEAPQTPIELFFILKTVARKGIKINTIAPKFSGNFYKGVDYKGNIDQFVKEFEQDILVIANAVDQFNLPSNLKLSIHSGSDKFSLYPRINNLLEKHDTGVHLKTSGTTWLEELIGLAVSGSEGLAMVKEIYKEAYGRYEELTEPYKTVISIEKDELPAPKTLAEWSRERLASTLRHQPNNPDLDEQLRQFLHCSYKIAAEKGQFIEMLNKHEKDIAPNVTNNLYKQHIKPLFAGK